MFGTLLFAAPPHPNVSLATLLRFHGWPSEALVSVAQRFLADVPNIEDSVRESVAYHMAYAHQVRLLSLCQVQAQQTICLRPHCAHTT